MKKSPIESSRRRPAGSLKRATAQLIEAAGGFERAAELCRVGRNALFRYTDPNDEHADRYMPVDVVRALEAEAGSAPVTEFLAAEQGCVLLHVDLVALPDDWASDIAETARAQAEMMQAAAQALADGEVTAAEAGEWLDAVQRSMAVHRHLYERLQAIRRETVQ